MKLITATLMLLTVPLMSACGRGDGKDGPKPPLALTINEVVSSNDGVNIDESGQTEDWIELINRSDTTINLAEYKIADSGAEQVLPSIDLAPDQVVLFWADDEPEEGPHHLPFKISSSGEDISLHHTPTETVQHFAIPALDTNISYARFPDGSGEFSRCRYTSANQSNGQSCQSTHSAFIPDTISFAHFPEQAWPNTTPTGLALNQLNLLPAQSIQLKNFSDSPVQLNDFQVILTPIAPTAAPSLKDREVIISLPDQVIDANATWTLAVSQNDTEELLNQPYFEGEVQLQQRSSLNIIDRVPFMHWPENTSLTRTEDFPYRFHFCQASNNSSCTPIASRSIQDRTRGLYTPNDFTELARESGKVNIQSVKFVIDIEDNYRSHFFASRKWPLHYSFVREEVEQNPVLDRCDATENQLFNNGWYLFSEQNYSSTTSRRFHLGTLSKHSNSQLNNVEFTFGDTITPAQILEAFFLVTQRMSDPLSWSFRPQDDSQLTKARVLEGSLPIVSPNAPFAETVYQGLAEGIAYGTLKFVPTEQLSSESLGNRVIVITNDVPNDIDFVGGLITESFQTPLAHVNILSQARNTPNMALPNASTQPEFQELIDKLVRLAVNEAGYTIAETTLEEAQTFWQTQETQTEVLIPRLDATFTELIDLTDADLNDIPRIGAKAAQLAELFHLNQINTTQCREGANFLVPEMAFAVPVAHYLRHMQDSGAQEYLDTLLSDDLFYSDLDYQRFALSTLRGLIENHDVDTSLLNTIETWIENRFGNKRVRFRSSSNTEDLQNFNGAGLYSSVSAELDDPDLPADAALKTVWASLWNNRAFAERDHANVDQTSVAMGVLIHQAFRNERANGVAVARNILSPLRVDQYYINSQAGEASVTNPAPGIITEQLIYQWPPRTNRLTYHSYSSLLPGTAVINATEIRALSCAMDAIQYHFAQRLDPNNENRWFTMESEFKFLGEERELLIKQARPFKFTPPDLPNDCRENI